MNLFQGIFSAPSWHTFSYLACGWVLARDCHPITTSLWLTGATTVQHFSRCYVFLGGPLYKRRWPLWGAVIRLAAQFVPEHTVMRGAFDDTTKKKAGAHIEGLARYRNGAGSARQDYRLLRGLHVVWGLRRMPRKHWPGYALSVPIGVELSLKEEQAQKLGVPSRSRSQLARAILDFAAKQLPKHQLRSLTDGGYATKDYVRELPRSVHGGGRLPITATLDEVPQRPEKKRRGAPRKKGAVIGSPKTLAATHTGWSPHPPEAGAEVQAWCGMWHSVLPGRLIRGVVLRRDTKRCKKKPRHRKPLPAVAAFFTTDLSLSADDIWREDGDRWSVEIAIRDANAFDGLGQDQCRKRQHLMGANTVRLGMAAARTLWFIDQVEGSRALNLCRYRPWYTQKVAPSHLDVVWACRDSLYEAGIFPIPRFAPDLGIHHQKLENAVPLAA